MLRFLFLFTFIFSFKVIAQTYEIAPLTYCPEFKVKVEKSTNFHLTFKLGPNSFSSEKTVVISNLNNLSSVTQELTLAAKRFCPLNLEVVSVDGILSCLPESLSEKPFSKEYISFLNQIIKITDQSWNSCEHIAPLIKLQLEISQIDQDTILSLEDSNDLLKVFTDDEVDKIIDLYHTCGGKKGTKEFLTNFILLEGKKQCLYPSPPGLLSFKEFKNIANSIGEKYKEEGIIGLNSDKNEIMKDTVLAVTKTILNTVTKDLLKPEEIDNVIKNSNVVTDIENIETKYIADYTKYILPIDASLKIIDEALLPITINKFGASFEDEKASLYVQDKIFPLIKDSYQECIEPIKSEIKFNSNIKLKDRIKYLKKKEEQFCKINNELCNKTGCDSYRNYTTTKSEIKDNQRIQACLFNAFQEGFEPTLEKLLLDQYKTIKDSLSYDPSDMQDMAKVESKLLKQCISKEIDDIGTPVSENFDQFHFISPIDFTNAISVCGKKAEKKITRYFTQNVLENLEPLQTFYNNKSDLKTISHKLTEKALNSCTEEQLKRVDQTKVSASLCLPIIEMTVAQHLVPQGIDQTLENAEIDPQTRLNIKDKFKTCSDKAITEALKKLYNKKGQHPIESKDRIASYLKREHGFFHCFQMGLDTTTQTIIDKSLKNLSKELTKNLKDPEYAKKILKTIEPGIHSCFLNSYKTFSSWPHFLSENEKGILDKIKVKCTEKATNFILPKIILNETENAISSLRSDLLLSKTLSAVLYNEELTQTQMEKRIIEDKNSFLAKNTDSSQEDFINDFKRRTQKKVINEVRNKIFLTLEKDSLFDTRIYALKEVLTPTCFNDLYDVSTNWPELKNLKPKENKNKDPLLTKLSQILISGIKTSTNLNTFDDFLESLKNICSKPETYKTLTSILETDIAKSFILNETSKEVKKAFIKTEIDQCIKDIKNLEMDFEEYGFKFNSITKPKSISEVICTEDQTSKSTFKRIKNRILREDGEKAILFDFIVKRKNKTLAAINDNINVNFINKIMTQESDLLNDLNSNLLQVLHGSEEYKNKINQKMVELIFKDRSTNSFSDQFLSAQIMASIGLQGYAVAKNQVDEYIKKIEGLPDSTEEKIKNHTLNSFIGRWRYEGIKHYMNWDNLTEDKKEEFYTLIYDQKIASLFNSSIPNSEKEEGNKIIKNYFLDYINNERNFKNPDFTQYQTRNGSIIKNGKEYLTFAEKLKRDMKSEVMRKYGNDIKDFFNPFK